MLSVWQPFPRFPIACAGGAPDANVYIVALLLTVASGLLFGAVPVKQILRTNPYEVIKAGPDGVIGSRIGAADQSSRRVACGPDCDLRGCWLHLRWLRCADWYDRYTATLVSSHGTPCWQIQT